LLGKGGVTGKIVLICNGARVDSTPRSMPLLCTTQNETP